MTKGLDKILANLTKLQVKAPRVAREAVTEVAEEFATELRANTPESFGTIRNNTALKRGYL